MVHGIQRPRVPADPQPKDGTLRPKQARPKWQGVTRCSGTAERRDQLEHVKKGDYVTSGIPPTSVDTTTRPHAAASARTQSRHGNNAAAHQCTQQTSSSPPPSSLKWLDEVHVSGAFAAASGRTWSVTNGYSDLPVLPTIAIQNDSVSEALRKICPRCKNEHAWPWGMAPAQLQGQTRCSHRDTSPSLMLEPTPPALQTRITPRSGVGSTWSPRCSETAKYHSYLAFQRGHEFDAFPSFPPK